VRPCCCENVGRTASKTPGHISLPCRSLAMEVSSGSTILALSKCATIQGTINKWTHIITPEVRNTNVLFKPSLRLDDMVVLRSSALPAFWAFMLHLFTRWSDKHRKVCGYGRICRWKTLLLSG
jgi:hypothetical protein